MTRPAYSYENLQGVLIALGSILTLTALSLTFLVGNQAQAQPVPTPTPFYGQLDHAYNLTIDNKNYTIQYGFADDKNVKLESMTVDLNAKTITIRIDDENPAHMADSSLSDWQNRTFAIELPRNVINSNSTDHTGGGCSSGPSGSIASESVHDIQYNIAVSSRSNDNSTIPFVGHISPGEMCGEHVRTLSITYPYGKSNIVIQGTTMIPEFGPQSLQLFIMTAGFVGAITGAIVVKNRERFI